MPLTSLFDREIGLESWFDEDSASRIVSPISPTDVWRASGLIPLGGYESLVWNGRIHYGFTSSGTAFASDDQCQTARKVNMPAGGNWNSGCALSSGRIILFETNAGSLSAYSDDDGITWTTVALPAGGNYVACASDDSATIVAVSKSTGTCVYSTNSGASYTSAAMPGLNYGDVGFGNGQFFATLLASSNQAAVASVGTPGTWTAVTMPSARVWTGVRYGDSKWVVISGGNFDFNTTDQAIASGASPASLTEYATILPTNSKWYKLAFNSANTSWMATINDTAGATSSAYSTSPTTAWTSKTHSNSLLITGLVSGNNAFVTVGFGPSFASITSTDTYGVPSVSAVTASGALASMSLSTPTGGAQPVRVASGSMPFIALSAPTGIAQPTVIASGALPVLALSAPNATATAVVTASGLLAAVSLSVPAGAASSVQTATGALAALTLSAPTALAQPDAVASGTLAAISLGAPTAAASVSGSVTATGTLAGMLLSAPTALAQPVAVASGTLASISLTAPSGSAQQTVIASGSLAAVSLGVPTATASAAVTASGAMPFVSLGFPVGVASVNPGDVTASSDIRAISLSAPTAIATVISDVTASGELRILQLFRPEGFASFVQAPLLGRPHRGGWDDEMPVREVYKPAPKTPSDRFADSLRAPYRKPTKLAPAVAPFTRIESVRRVATAVSQLETTPFTPFAPFAAIIAQPAAPALVDEIPDEVYIIASLF